ncbi:MAG: hypothetical protein AB7I19_10520 [Planctomycetota bacterium]
MTRRVLTAVSLMLVAGCSLPALIERIDEESPRAELGRPGWVRAPATLGTWVGGAVGSVAALPFAVVAWPFQQLATDNAGRLDEDFLFAPAGSGASAGHFLLGAPFDLLDWTFRRAWIDDEPAVVQRPAAAAAGDLPSESKKSASSGDE